MSEKIWRLAELSSYIQLLLSEDPLLGDIWIQGEVTGFHHHQPSGHVYFSLTEADIVLHCVWFGADLGSLAFQMENGLQILIRGRITIYPGKSQYQVRILEVAAAGVGTLYQNFENLKKKLAAQGLFDDLHKRPLPRLPMRIAVVTSPVGAARKDIEDNLKVRYPLAELVICGAQVQGDGAVESIRTALKVAIESAKADVLIIARGGGSFEDLNPFNDEALARDIYAATIPIVTGIGHQKDFTIADFVADQRAGTPSHAVELCTPDVRDLRLQLIEFTAKLQRTTRLNLENRRLRVTAAERASFFRKAEAVIEGRMQRIDDLRSKMATALTFRLRTYHTKIEHLRQSLALANPQAVVDRGFAICYDTHGAILTDVKSVDVGDTIKVKLKNGALDSQVTRRETVD